MQVENNATTGNTATLNVSGGRLTIGGTTNGGLNLIQDNASGGGKDGTAVFNQSGGVTTTSKINFGLGSANTGTSATVNVTGGELYIGSGGITKNASFTSLVIAINLSGGTVGADADWTSVLGMTLFNANGGVTFKAARENGTSQSIGLGGVLSGTGFTKTGAGTLTLSGANTYTGATTISAGTAKAGVASVANTSGAFGNNSAITLANVSGATLDITGFNTQIGSITGGGATGGNVTLGAATLTVGGDNTSPAAYAGAISGTGALTKIGTGKQILSGANTYSGVTTISAGTLQFGKQTSLYNNTTASWTAANIKVASGATAAFNVGGTGEFTTGNVTTLLTNLDGAVSSNGLQSGSKIGFDTTNASGATFTVADAIADTTGTGGGSVGVAKLGANTLVFSGSNTYTGGTTISAGTLQVGNGGSTGNLGSGGVTDNGSLIYNRTGTLTEANIIAGTGSLTQAGTGTTILTQASTYSGGTTVTGGGLKVSNISGSATGSGGVSLGAATLTGTGAISGTVTTAGTGSIIAPATTGTIGNLSLGGIASSGLTLNFAIDGVGATNSSLTLGSGGFAAAGSTLTLNLYDLGTNTLATNTPYTLVTGTGTWTAPSILNGTLFGSTYTLDTLYGVNGFLFNTTTHALSFELAAVPEPGTWAMMFGGLGALFFIQFRRRNR